MMKRDSQGYIISKLPASARMYKDMKYLVVPEENGFPEYTPEAYNYVNAFFRNEMRVTFDIDNLNDKEWHENVGGDKIVEIKNTGRIAFDKNRETFAEGVVQNLVKKIKKSDMKEYKENIENKTVLDVCIVHDNSEIHIELPYCTVEKICEYTKRT